MKIFKTKKDKTTYQVPNMFRASLVSIMIEGIKKLGILVEPESDIITLIINEKEHYASEAGVFYNDTDMTLTDNLGLSYPYIPRFYEGYVPVYNDMSNEDLKKEFDVEVISLLNCI